MLLFIFPPSLQESRHALGMRCLGIPNTAHFANVTSIEDALACKNFSFVLLYSVNLTIFVLSVIFWLHYREIIA